jgi:hypothetical protein
MPLRSRLFAGDRRLEACLIDDKAHLTQGTRGDFVSKVHTALFLVDGPNVDAAELRAQLYGRSVNQSSFKLLKNPTTGRPPEADLQAVLDAPAGERANAVGKRAEAATVTGNKPNRSDNESRFVTVPEDFWL